MESVPRSGDSGISSIIAVVLLLALVVLCASIVSLIVLQSVQNAAPETLHAQFQASANENRLYLTGGDVLPIADLTFYDKNGTVISDYVTFPNGKTGTNGNSGVWTPGEFITTDANVTLGSIVAKSANGNSVLVYRASGSSASLPTGDMVPDWFTIPPLSQGGNTSDYEIGTTYDWWELVEYAKKNSGASLGHGIIYSDGISIYCWVSINHQYLSQSEANQNLTIEEYTNLHPTYLLKINLSTYIYTTNDIDGSDINSPWKIPAPVCGSLYDYDKKLYICIQTGATDPNSIWRISRNPANIGDWLPVGTIKS